MSNILKKNRVPCGTKNYTHQDLKGGLFNIPSNETIDLYTYLLIAQYNLFNYVKVQTIIKGLAEYSSIGFQ